MESLWIIFSLSFLTALTGALSPGPLLTYTIIKTMESRKHGYLMGFAVIAGHALLEMMIVIALLSGLSFFLKNIIVIRVVSVTGCLFLVYFGITIIRDAVKGKIQIDFIQPGKSTAKENNNKHFGLKNPVIGGIVTSMSNPYWWIWWASIGSAFWVNFNISSDNIPGIIAFFFGHEAGDLIWYVFVSFIIFFGKGFINRKIYIIILVLCGIFMILFGLYLGISPFFKSISL
ncbi:MAG: LysE family transporter [Spirochaetales bacterium]|nr:LysE family transporter [Spirochaetales bacterium]